MRRRFLLIENVIAGYGRRSLCARVVDVLQRSEAHVERCPGQSAADTRRLIAEAGRGGTYDAVIAAGGDGTIRHAAGALAGSAVPLGIIPLGTANVLAHELGLPRQPEALASLLLTGMATTLVAPTANGEVFLLMAGVGFDGQVIGALSHAVKGHIGKLAYAIPLIGALRRRPDDLQVLIDGRSYRATWAVITNARHYGGRFVIARSTSVREPGLRAVLFTAADRAELAACLLALASGRLDTCRHAVDVACTRVEIGNRAVPVQVDGDAFAHTPLVVEAGGPRVSLITPPTTTASGF